MFFQSLPVLPGVIPSEGGQGGEGGQGVGPSHGLQVPTGVSCQYKDVRQVLKSRLQSISNVFHSLQSISGIILCKKSNRNTPICNSTFMYSTSYFIFFTVN